jgi:hypothetical protein
MVPGGVKKKTHAELLGFPGTGQPMQGPYHAAYRQPCNYRATVSLLALCKVCAALLWCRLVTYYPWCTTTCSGVKSLTHKLLDTCVFQSGVARHETSKTCARHETKNHTPSAGTRLAIITGFDLRG